MRAYSNIFALRAVVVVDIVVVVVVVVKESLQQVPFANGHLLFYFDSITCTQCLGDVTFVLVAVSGCQWVKSYSIFPH